MNTNTKFLVVDDFSEMREHIKSLLQDIGFCHIHEAEDGNAVLDKLQAENFDFIVSNWQVSNMDGLVAAQAGANGYLVRPFSAAILRDKLNLIFKNINNQS